MAKAPLALTMGEPAGIGGEIALKAWRNRIPAEVPPFVLVDDPARIEALARDLDWPVPVAVIDRPADAVGRFDEALPVLPVGEPVEARPGQLRPETAGAVLRSIETAVSLVRAGLCSAIVTNPIHKAVLYDAGFRHPGHTEYLGHLTDSATPPVMMLAIAELKVVPATVHVPLKDVPARLTAALVERTGRIVADSLRDDFGIGHPRLAFAGLNPHAGEGGALGREEQTVIGPAIEALRLAGLAVSGPHPADSLFHAAARRGYDAAICMYHDQALIPLKTLDFDQGVNVTLGLPLIRTSPDHGTALDIAGRGVASAASLVAALKLAATMVDHRSRAAA